MSGEHLLELLGDPHSHHPRAGGVLPQRAHHVDLAVVSLEPQDRDVVGRHEGAHRGSEAVPHVRHDRRGRDGAPQMTSHEHRHLTRHLKIRDVGVQINPVQALQVQLHMTYRPARRLRPRWSSSTPDREDRLGPLPNSNRRYVNHRRAATLGGRRLASLVVGGGGDLRVGVTSRLICD